MRPYCRLSRAKTCEECSIPIHRRCHVNAMNDTMYKLDLSFSISILGYSTKLNFFLNWYFKHIYIGFNERRKK